MGAAILIGAVFRSLARTARRSHVSHRSLVEHVRSRQSDGFDRIATFDNWQPLDLRLRNLDHDIDSN